jgi:ABC-type transport system involved in multi-copper enzyme maturation permease subunit
MLWLIIKKEYLLNLISLRFVIAFLLAASLTVLSAFILIDDYKARLKEYGGRSASHFEQLASGYSYSDLLDDEVAVDKEPARLSVFVQGIEHNVNPVVKFRNGEYPVLSESVSENPLFSLFRKIDFLFVVQYIMSLMALFFAYDNISGEKEAGTFRLVFSYPVPRDTIILGKVIGGFSCLITPLAVAFLASLTLVAVKGVGFSAEDYKRAGAIFLASVLFLLCLYMLGIMISAATRSAVTSLFVSLFVWTILVFNIPPLSHLAAKQLFRAPEYSSVLSSVSAVRQEVQKGFMGRSIQHGMENEAAPSLDTIYRFYREEKQEGDDKIRRVLEQHEAYLRAQIEGARRLSRVSPVAAFANSAMQIGNTGLEEQYDFIGSVRRYQRDLFDFIARIEKKNSAINAANLPRYTYRREALGSSLAGAAVDLSVLALFTAGFFITAYYLFLKYDIR